MPQVQHGDSRLRLFAADGDNQALAALGTTSRDHLPAGRCRLACPKTVSSLALDVVWLVRPLHGDSDRVPQFGKNHEDPRI